jgi:hypothetical protein
LQGWFEDGGIDIEKIATANGVKIDKGILQYEPKQSEEDSETKQ